MNRRGKYHAIRRAGHLRGGGAVPMGRWPLVRGERGTGQRRPGAGQPWTQGRGTRGLRSILRLFQQPRPTPQAALSQLPTTPASPLNTAAFVPIGPTARHVHASGSQ